MFIMLQAVLLTKNKKAEATASYVLGKDGKAIYKCSFFNKMFIGFVLY